MKFTPVHSLYPSPSLSGISTLTKLDQLYGNEENLCEFESILNTPTESVEFSLATEPQLELSIDPDPCENEDKSKQRCDQNNSQRSIQSDPEHAYLTDTPWASNGIEDDQQEISLFNLDDGFDRNSGISELLMDDNKLSNITGQLSEASLPTIDTHIHSDMPHDHFNGEIQSEKLSVSNGYVRLSTNINDCGQEESSSTGMIDDLNCDFESIMITLDDLGPTERRLEDTSGYIPNDQL